MICRCDYRLPPLETDGVVQLTKIGPNTLAGITGVGFLLTFLPPTGVWVFSEGAYSVIYEFPIFYGIIIFILGPDGWISGMRLLGIIGYDILSTPVWLLDWVIGGLVFLILRLLSFFYLRRIIFKKAPSYYPSAFAICALVFMVYLLLTEGFLPIPAAEIAVLLLNYRYRDI